ncbi:heterokaryon incompatibility protein-domain-containing protein [Apodospora peruviana]|uniref:Heterokaryon incompatibility protein-domain-containing protein n=1 Tax=Apodospora peruviana TaxID=516989 RepID=A0AAE0IDH3_9PEZI|nr:heterokaryon incompatibility protein-domain-containing protein [Apodospora peruviana]
MWLINTSTMRLEHLLQPESVKYAILSHTWEDGEVSFQEFSNPTEVKEPKAGYAKIQKTCELAESEGLMYAWVDTCCIDKTSSAELTEAINSMFKWYKDAEVCYAFIADLPPGGDDDWLSGDQTYRWFTRGWTLQELIAPRQIRFYDAGWEFRGTKAALRNELSQVTGIDARVLGNSALLPQMPVARKMSWASRRQTTRMEDMAYCLLGIFDVHMPLIYGEGQRAFVRLQEEISKETNDLSLFAWTASDPSVKFRGILATSPSEFASCHGLMRYHNYLDPNPDFTMTNNGVKIEARVGNSLNHIKSQFEDILALECCRPRPGTGKAQLVGIYISKTALGWVRLDPGHLHTAGDMRVWTTGRKTIYIQKFLRDEQIQQISLGLESRMYVHYNLDGYRHAYAVQDIFSSPETLWFGTGHSGHFLTMESAAEAADHQTTIYPPFTAFQTFNLYHGDTHICQCLLICGLFTGCLAENRSLPVAVLYTDKDPCAKELFEVANSKTKREGRRWWVLSYFRRFLIENHAPGGQQPLTWEDVRTRVVEVLMPGIRTGITLSIGSLESLETATEDSTNCKDGLIREFGGMGVFFPWGKSSSYVLTIHFKRMVEVSHRSEFPLVAATGTFP